MGKGDKRRPCLVPKDEYDARFDSVFGPKKPNLMSEEDRKALVAEDTTSYKVSKEDSNGKCSSDSTVPQLCFQFDDVPQPIRHP